MKLVSEGGIESARTKIFYYTAVFVVIGELLDNLTAYQVSLPLIVGFTVVGVSIIVLFLRYKEVINNPWANAIILYLLLVDVTLATYLTINKEDFTTHFTRLGILLCAIVPYAGFNIQKYHSIIVAAFFLINYVIISVFSGDEHLIKSIPIVMTITFAYVLGIYLLIDNLFQAYNAKKELLKKAELTNTALTEQKKELKEAIESKNALFSIIFHDLRNPFNTIMGFNELVEIALQKNDIDKIHKYHPLIKRSTENAYLLTKNLFDWARYQKGDFNFEPSKFNFDKIVSGVLNLVSNDANQKKINIATEIREDHTIVADKNMIDTIIRNLLTNAIKFTPENGKITIGVELRDNQIIYFIRDTGIGASKEKLENMFSGKLIESERGTRNEKGSGLGLNICKDFIEKHHGKLWAEPNNDIGITVYFTIGV